MNTPLVSVIIPIYNVSDYLDACVESACRQSYANLEIILVDDGSPDDCPHKCDVWAEKDARIRVVHKPNGGLSDARNAGLDTAT
ncbi:MAG: glycosyltransferase, partial [Clostridia bacterium]|nr:glycosyltransferase [Clostridia bacterium]